MVAKNALRATRAGDMRGVDGREGTWVPFAKPACKRALFGCGAPPSGPLKTERGR